MWEKVLAWFTASYNNIDVSLNMHYSRGHTAIKIVLLALTTVTHNN